MWRNARTCLKPGIFFVPFFKIVFFLFFFFFVGVCLLYCNHLIHNDCNVLGSDGQEVYWRVCCCLLTAHWCLHLWRGWVWKCECGCECFFFYMKPWLCWHVAEFDIFYQSIWCWAIGCSSWSCVCKIWHIVIFKGKVLNQVLNVVFAVHSCLQLFKNSNAPVDTTIPERTRFS